MVGKVDGVMTADPSKDKNARLIPEITIKNYAKIKSSLTSSDGVDVTGGMLSKVESMLELAKKGIESEIINGDKPGNLLRALKGEKRIGTVITN
jgi:isopentenyl phosphate kinase